jgi:hypothetical protein
MAGLLPRRALLVLLAALALLLIGLPAPAN